MSGGIIFDIKEFAVFDGPGIRTTVFFKGCPLRCTWCHNPEGLKPEKELMKSFSGCTHCRACERVCPSPVKCTACGACVRVCPMGLRRIAGTEYEAADLAKKLLRNAAYLKSNGGGYTISGGEPTAQGEFLLELLGCLRGNHRAVDSSGFCPRDLFVSILEETELILFDLKLIDGKEHSRWTGTDNTIILENLDFLKRSGKDYVIRIPAIPGVNDTIYEKAAELLEGSPHLRRVEILPYHKTAGAKYPMLGLSYEPGFDTEAEQHVDVKPFVERNIPVVVF